MAHAGYAALAKRVDRLIAIVPYRAVSLQSVRLVDLAGLPRDAAHLAAEDALVDAMLAAQQAPTCPAGCFCDWRCARYWPHLLIELYCGPRGTLCAGSMLGLLESDYLVPGGTPRPHGGALWMRTRRGADGR